MDKFYFNFSVSVSKYDRNLDADKTKFLKWRELKGTINDLCGNIQNNFAFCHTYNHFGDTFNNGLKTATNFNQTNLICFDFDAVRLSANDFFNKMKNTAICPNIVYTTTNNGHFKEGKNEIYNNRYRAIYVVDEPIINGVLYTEMHQTIKRFISDYLCDKNIFNDNSDNNVSHFFAGSENCQMFVNDSAFSLKDLMCRLSVKTANERNINADNVCPSAMSPKSERREREGKYISYLIERKKKSILRLHDIEEEEKKEYYSTVINFFKTFSDIENDDFIKDYYALDFNALYSKYSGRDYLNIVSSPMEYDGKNIVVKTPSEYFELRRPFCTVDGYTKRIKDGERRRKQLFTNLKLRKQITPSLTLQNLLYNAVYEMVYYIDNKEDSITKYEIAQTAVNAYFSEYTSDKKVKCTPKKFKIDPIFCMENNIQKKCAAMLYLNEKREKQRENNLKIFSDNYSPKLTDKENFEIMKNKGLTAKSLQTFKKYKEQLGMTKKRQNKCDISADNKQMEQLTTTTIKSAHAQNKVLKNGTNARLKMIDNNKENNMNMATYNKQMERLTTTTIKGAQTQNKSDFWQISTTNTFANYPFFYPLKNRVEMLNFSLIVRYNKMVQNLRYMAV